VEENIKMVWYLEGNVQSREIQEFVHINTGLFQEKWRANDAEQRQQWQVKNPWAQIKRLFFDRSKEYEEIN
jgi:hypothetical protein